MSKFILVHEVPTGNPVVVKSEDIAMVKKSNVYEGASSISNYVYEYEPCLHVTESPEKIYEMLIS